MAVIRDPTADVIKAGATKVTTASGFAAGIVVLATAIDPVFEAVFGKDVPDSALTNEKAAVLIAAIAGWALIAAIDLIARSYATAQSQPQIASAPSGMTATRTRGTPGDVDEPGYSVAAVRFDPAQPDEAKTKFLIVKAGKTPEWVSSSDLTLS